MRRLFLTLTASVFSALPCLAQWFGTASDNIRTPRVITAGDWERLPVLTDGETLEISFDEMSHNYHRFTYHITHCNAGWETSDLLESEYLDGFNDQPVDSWENSENTTFDYTHYRLQIPNEDIRLKVSGNYRVSIQEDDEELAWFRFSVSEGMPLLSMEQPTGNTDIDTRESHQQIGLTVNYSSLDVRNPDRELKVTVMQNHRFDNAAISPKATYENGRQLTFDHCRDLVFPAGNEFRRFEVINMYENVRRVDRISFHAPYYHAAVMTDREFHAYQYDDDHNGRFLVRYSNADDSDIQADYLFVHFRLESPEYQGGKLYVTGDFSGGSLTPEYEMEYADGAYQATLLLKNGAYDYRYLWVPAGKNAGETAKTEGDWYETGNEYHAFLYYRPRNGRYDRLVSVSSTGR